MPSCFSHFAVAAALGHCAPQHRLPRRYLLLGMFLAAAPDLDTIGYWLGVPYESPLGHRGLFHSMPFAFIAAVLVTAVVLRFMKWGGHPSLVFGYLLICALSHGLLDTLTNGGLGIALLAPFSDERYFAPITPIEVAPLDPKLLFTDWGIRVVWSEVLLVGLPTGFVCLFVAAMRYAQTRRVVDSNEKQL